MAKNTIAYYDANAGTYDLLHGERENPEHTAALELARPLISDVSAVVDVGCGTGRTLSWFSRKYPGAALAGIDPSPGLLTVASAALPGADLRQGYGERLPFLPGSADLVSATGILHHADKPAVIVDEMFRISRRYILISDHNNFAFGSRTTQSVRLLLHSVNLLSFFQYVKQGFRKQGYSQDDGWWYPFSLFSLFGQLSSLSERLYLIPTRRATGPNLVTGQSHIAVLAIKREQLASDRLLPSE